ncbi:MAG: hypothetical protein K6A43_12300 [Treponema sp.]|nr:hypothetical protein [Treponema sp.]
MNKKCGFYKAELFALLCFVVLVFDSCSFVKNSVNDDSLNNETASVCISVNGNSPVTARTALPSIRLDSYSYTIKAKNQKTDIEEILASGLSVNQLSDQRFTIKRARWIFSVLAYLIVEDETSGEQTVSDEPVFEGNSSEIDLENKTTAVVNMSLKATTTGTGTVVIPVSYTSKGVKRVTCGLYNSPTDGELLEGKTIQTWTTENGIEQNQDGTYSVLFTDEEVPSGKTIYARFILYDENNVPVGYYTEAVYVVKDEVSKPIVYIKDENGDYQTDEEGNFVQNTEAESVEVETNLFPATISAEKDKKFYAETTVTDENGTERTIVYELYDEDDDGVYDTVLPPGDYTIKVSEKNETVEQAEVVRNEDDDDNVPLNVNTQGGKSIITKLAAVKVSSPYDETEYYDFVGNTINLRAISNSNKEIPLPNPDITIQWFVSDSKDGDFVLIKDESDSENYSLPALKVNGNFTGKYIKAKFTQNYNKKTITKETRTVHIRKGKLDVTTYELYKDGTEAVETTIKMLVGQKLDSSEFTVTNLKDEYGNEIESVEISFGLDEDKEMTASKTVTLTITVPGYEPIEKTIFVEVQAVVSNIVVTISGDIQIQKTVSESTVNFAASAGFEDYTWTIDGMPVAQVEGAVVNEDDSKLLNVNTANWIVGEYKVGLTAKKNGLIYSSTATISVTE